MIVNRRALEPDYIPQNLQHREGYVDALSMALEPLTHGEYGEDSLLSGPSGTGKTTLAKYVTGKLAAHAPAVRVGYVNCIGETTTAALAALVRDLGLGISRPEGTSKGWYLDQLRSTDDQVVCILDEVTALADTAVLHALYEIPAVTQVASCLSEDRLFTDLPQQVESRLRTFERLPMERYKHAELVDIVQYRVDAGLVSSRVADDAIAEIANRAAGDARAALAILRQAAVYVVDCDLDRLTPAVVERVAEVARTTIQEQQVQSLDTHQHVLYETIRQAGSKGITGSELHECYEEQVGSPRARGTRRKLLDSLERYGLIEQRGSGRGTRYFVSVGKT